MKPLKCVPWIAYIVAAYQLATFVIPSLSHPGLAVWWALGNIPAVITVIAAWILARLMHRGEAMPEGDRDSFASQVSLAVLLTASIPILTVIKEDTIWPVLIAPVVVFLHMPIIRPWHLILPILLLAPATVVALTAGKIPWTIGSWMVIVTLAIHVIASIEDSTKESTS